MFIAMYDLRPLASICLVCRFVESVGAVAHRPVATLDFPLTNAPDGYPRRHSFAGQVDEAMLDEALQALRHQDNAASATAEDADTAHRSGTDTNSSSAAALVDMKSLEEGTRGPKSAAADKSIDQEGVPAGSRSATAAAAFAAATASSKSATAKAGAVQLPLRRSPSGTMQLNPLDPAVAVQPRLTVSELLLRTLPIWMTVLVLLLTRIPALPIKKVLQR
jgi:hypothetical protein